MESHGLGKLRALPWVRCGWRPLAIGRWPPSPETPPRGSCPRQPYTGRARPSLGRSRAHDSKTSLMRPRHLIPKGTGGAIWPSPQEHKQIAETCTLSSSASRPHAGASVRGPSTEQETEARSGSTQAAESRLRTWAGRKLGQQRRPGAGSALSPQGQRCHQREGPRGGGQESSGGGVPAPGESRGDADQGCGLRVRACPHSCAEALTLSAMALGGEARGR